MEKSQKTQRGVLLKILFWLLLLAGVLVGKHYIEDRFLAPAGPGGSTTTTTEAVK